MITILNRLLKYDSIQEQCDVRGYALRIILEHFFPFSIQILLDYSQYSFFLTGGQQATSWAWAIAGHFQFREKERRKERVRTIFQSLNSPHFFD